MSTRAVIARKTATGFQGVYHHSDGYPSWLGVMLFHLRRDRFAGNTAAMLQLLIDGHPNGWSSVPGQPYPPDDPDMTLTEADASAYGCEYAYVFDGNGTLEIQASYHQDGSKAIGYFGSGDPQAEWRTFATVKLDEPCARLAEDRGGHLKRPLLPPV